jgi:hypothetical protein
MDMVRQATPDATISIKWGQPVAEHRGPFCWMRAHSNHVNIGFWRGSQLGDPGQVLEGSGTKMRHVKIHDKASVPMDALKAFVAEAVGLNEQYGNPAMMR